VFIWRLFNERVIRPHVWGEPTREDVLRKAMEEEIPGILDHLEPQLPEQGYLFEEISLADIALAAPLRNAAWAGFQVDASRWPRSAAFFARVLDHPGFVRLRPFEETLLRTPIPRQREALREAGAPLTDESFATGTPRRGVLSI
jgi:glutathione S-transferase